MVQSVNEKRELIRKQKDLEEYENEMLRRYAQQQKVDKPRYRLRRLRLKPLVRKSSKSLRPKRKT